MKNKRIAHRISLSIVIIAALFVYTSALASGEILDSSFGTNGVVTANFGVDSRVSSIALQSDGKILLLGFAYGQTPVLQRYNANGSLDNTFGTSGSLPLSFGTKVAVQSDGKVVIAGSNNGSFAVARYDSNGTNLDTAFGTNGIAALPADAGENNYVASDLAIESDGKIVVVGTQHNQGNFINLVVARFNSNGTPFEDVGSSTGLLILDQTNFPNSRYNYGQAVAVQSDGKIVASGTMMDDDASGQISLVRLNQDSTLDTLGFGSNGEGTVTAAVPTFHYHPSSMTLQTNGKIIVVGTTSDLDDLVNDLVVARFNSNGSLDTTFGGSGIVITNFGANEFGKDVDLQADGKILVVGASSNNQMIVRYNSNGLLDNTFGSGGKLIGGINDGSTSTAQVEIQTDGKILVAGSSAGDAYLARYVVDVPPPPTVTPSPTFTPSPTPTLRPTTTLTVKSTAGHDGFILESGENTNAGGTLNSTATTLNVGDESKDRQYRSFLSFNTATLPDNATITAVRLEIKRQGLVGIDPFSTHGNLLLDIKSSAFSNNLALQLVDFNAASTPGGFQENIAPTADVWYILNLNSANLGFINKVGVTQFRLRFASDDNEDLNADYLKFFSGNSTAANIPKLVITYFVP